VFYELYRDRAAFAEHEEQPHVKHFLSERAQHLESHEVAFLALIAGRVGHAAMPSVPRSGERDAQCGVFDVR
jgi:hypothetical protein